MRNELLPLLRHEGTKYIDLFCGSLALPLQFRPGIAIFNDVNRYLINVFETIRDDIEELLTELERLGHQQHDNAQSFKIFQTEYNTWKAMDEFPPIRMAALFIYLNRRGFNGLYRENRKGEFNVPYRGTSKYKPIHNEAVIRDVHEYLSTADVTFCSVPYQELEGIIDSSCVVYLDPPYYPSETSKFTSYWSSPFGPTQHEELAAFVRRIASRGAKVVMTNAPCPEVKQLYSGFQMQELIFKRRMRSAKTHQQTPEENEQPKPNELIVHNLSSE